MNVVEELPNDVLARQLHIKKKYNAEKAKRSYEKKKSQISKTRILRRVGNGQSVNLSTINTDKHAWTDDELRMLKERKDTEAFASYVPSLSVPVMERHSEALKETSLSHLQMQPDDVSSQYHIWTRNECLNKTLSLQQAVDILKFCFKERYLMGTRPIGQKQICMESYISKLKAIMNICGTENLLDVYLHIENFHNRLCVSPQINTSSLSGYFSILVTLYKYSINLPEEGYVRLHTLLHPEQFQKIKAYTRSSILLLKELEIERTHSAQFYLFEDFKKLVEIIKDHPNRNTIQGMRDLVIIHMYVYELVLRDDLGMVKIVHENVEFERNKAYNYYNVNNRELHMHQYKTSKYYINNKYEDRTNEKFITKLFPDTGQIITAYLNKMLETLNPVGTKPKDIVPIQYLITKDDGTPYKNGKLAGYVSDIFKRYAQVNDITINSIRHSFVAAVNNDDPDRFREYMMKTMRHSHKQNEAYDRAQENGIPFIKQNVEVQVPIWNKRRCIMDESTPANVKVIQNLAIVVKHEQGRQYTLLRRDGTTAIRAIPTNLTKFI